MTSIKAAIKAISGQKGNLKNSLGDMGDDLKDDVKIRAQQVAIVDGMDINHEVNMSSKHDTDKLINNNKGKMEGVQ